MRSREWALRPLLAKELRVLSTSQSYWLLLLVVGLLVGHGFMTSVNLYAEASGIGGGPAALSQGLSPLEGIVVPTFGAYDIAATLLFPFVVIRLVAGEKQTGELALTLQAPPPLSAAIAAKAIALLVAWIVAGIAGAIALGLWASIGGHLAVAETLTVVLGHLLRGALTIGIASAAGAVAASAASAAIVALTITLGTWALDYVAAARGGAVEAIAAYTPSAALRVFERGELRASTVLVVLALALTGLAIASAWLREGNPLARRVIGAASAVIVGTLLCVGFGRVRASWDVSENRRNSFTRIDEGVLRSITVPLHVRVNLAAEDPRLSDLERGVLSKLRRTMRDVHVSYVASSRSGLFDRQSSRYGEVWYQLATGPDARAEMTRSTTEAIVLETIYALAGRGRPASANEAAYSGYPLARRSDAAPWIFFLVWPVLVVVVWWWIRRPRFVRLRTADMEIR